MTIAQSGRSLLEELESSLDIPTDEQVQAENPLDAIQTALDQPSQEVLGLQERAAAMEAELAARALPGFTAGPPSTAIVPVDDQPVSIGRFQGSLDVTPFISGTGEFRRPASQLTLINREREKRGLEEIDEVPGPQDLVEFLVDDLLTGKGVKTRLPFLGGFAEAKDLWSVFLASQRAEKGLAGPDDFRRILDYQEALLAQQRGTTFPAGVASLLSDTLPFMAEFLVSGGLINVGRAALRVGARKILKRETTSALAGMAIKPGVTAALRRGVGKAVDLTVMSAARVPFFVGHVKRQTIERLIPEMSIYLEDSGDLDLIILAPGEDEETAIRNASVDTFVQLFSERLGGLINKPVGYIGRVARTRAEKIIGAKLPTLKIGASSLLRRAGFSTILGEVGEERAAEFILDGLTRFDLANSPREPLTFKRLATEVVGFTILPLGAGVLGGATRRPREAVESKVSKVAAPAREAREAQEDEMRRILTPQGAAEIVAALSEEAKIFADKPNPSRKDFDQFAERLPNLQGAKLDGKERAAVSASLATEFAKQERAKLGAKEEPSPETIVLDPSNVSTDPLPAAKGKEAAPNAKEWLRRFVAKNPEIRERPWFTVRRGKLVFDGQSTTTVEPDFFGDIGEVREGQKIVVDVDKFAPPKVKDRATPESGRIVPKEPLEVSELLQPPGKRLVSNHEIIATLSKRFDVPVRFGRIRQKNAAGVFKVRDEVIRVKGKFAGDLAVHTNQLGHLLEKRFDILKDAPEAAIAEVAKLDHNEKRRDPEKGFAAFIELFLTEDNAAELSPEFAAYFDSVLASNPELQVDLSVLKNLINQHRAQGPLGRMRANLVRKNKPDRPLGTPLLSQAADTLERAWDATYSAMKFDAHFLNKFVREAKRKGLKRALGETSIEKHMAFSQAGPVHAQFALENGVHTIGENPRKIGPSMVEVLENIDDGADYRLFAEYAWASHALEAWEKDKNPGISREDAERVFTELDSPRYREAHAKLTQFNAALVEMLYDAGVINEESRDEILSEYERYVPLLRAVGKLRPGGQLGSRNKLLNLQDPIKTRRGSGLPVIDPIYATVQYAMKFYDRAAKQIVTDAMIREAEEVGGLGKWITKVDANLQKTEFDIKEVRKQLQDLGVDEEAFADIDPEERLAIWRPNYNVDGRNVVRHRNPDGTTELYELDPNLGRAIDGMSPVEFGVVLEMFGRFTRLLKLGATTLNIEFAARNALRDQFTYHAQRKYAQGVGAFLTPAEMVGLYIYSQGQKAIGKKGDPIVELYDQWGGQLAPLLGMDVKRNSIRKEVKKALNSSAQQKALHIVSHPITLLREIVNVSEVGPRLAEFKAALASQGWTRKRILAEGSPPRNVLINGINASNDVTVNFKRMGTIGRQLNQIIPFFNASLEGVDKFARTFKDDPKRAMSMAMIGSASTVAYWMKVQDEDWYKTAPDWLKYGFWTITDENGKPTAHIPVPFEWGWVVKSGTEALLNSIVGAGGKEELMKYAKMAPIAMFPPFQPSLITPLMESFMDYDLHLKRPIVPPSRRRFEKRDQYSPYNTHTMRAIGEFVSLSPAKLERTVDGLTGGLFTKVLKPLERAITGEEANEADVPILGTFKARREFSKEVDQVFRDSAKALARLNSAKLRNEETPSMKAEDKKLRDATGLIKDLGKLNEGLVNRDERFENATKYQIGLARYTVGEEPLDRYPNPLTEPNPPEAVEEMRAQFLGSKLVDLSAPDTDSTKEGAEERRRFTVKFAKNEIKRLGIPIEQVIYRDEQNMLRSPLLEREWVRRNPDMKGRHRTAAFRRRLKRLANRLGVD